MNTGNKWLAPACFILSVVMVLLVGGCGRPCSVGEAGEVEAVGEGDLLTQRGDAVFIRVADERSTYQAEVYYPVPYESPPSLRFDDIEAIRLSDLKQTTEGFSVRMVQNPVQIKGFRWEARGIAKRRN